MEALLTTIVTWLSLNFGLPAIHDHPRIEFVPPARMEVVRFRARTNSLRSAADAKPAPRPGSRWEVEALYDDSSRTIYLRDDWTGATPREISVLVHEMVHHLQNLAGLRYECPQAREKLAYAAQHRWLAHSGRNLIDEFDLDPVTILVRTNCMH